MLNVSLHSLQVKREPGQGSQRGRLLSRALCGLLKAHCDCSEEKGQEGARMAAAGGGALDPSSLESLPLSPDSGPGY